MARIPDLLDGYGPEDEDVIPRGLLDDEDEEEAGPALPAVGGVAPPPVQAPKTAEALLDEAFSYSPPPMVEAPKGKDTALADAQRADRKSANMGRASDALYSAFSRRGLQNTGGGTDKAGELLKRRALEQGEADRAKKATERTADRASIAAALGVDEAQLAGLSDAGLSQILGVKVGERKAAASARIAESSARAKAEQDRIAREEALAKEQRDRGFQTQQSELDRASRERAARLSAGNRSEERELRREDAQGAKVQASLEKYGEKVAAPAEEFLEQFAQVEEVQNKHKGSSDVPGVGFWDNNFLVPDFARSEDGLKLRKAAGQMMAAYQKLITGSGASDAERANLAKIGADLGSEKGFPAGLKALKSAFDAKMRALNASYDPAVSSTYRERNPSTRMDFGGSAPAPASSGTVTMKDKNGVSYTVDAAEAEEAEANGWTRVD